MTRVVEIKRLAEAIGSDIKGIRSDAVQVTTSLGQSDTLAVSQKLLTNRLGDIETLLDAINGEQP
jgi:hypothetical protein